jgi:hypothetical protein
MWTSVTTKEVISIEAMCITRDVQIDFCDIINMHLLDTSLTDVHVHNARRVPDLFTGILYSATSCLQNLLQWHTLWSLHYPIHKSHWGEMW